MRSTAQTVLVKINIASRLNKYRIIFKQEAQSPTDATQFGNNVSIGMHTTISEFFCGTVKENAKYDSQNYKSVATH